LIAQPYGRTTVKVGRDDNAGVPVQLAQQVEQQRTAGLAERQVAQFIEDHQVQAPQAAGKSSGCQEGDRHHRPLMAGMASSTFRQEAAARSETE